MYIYQDLRFS